VNKRPPKPKVDNRSLKAKVELRRWLLDAMGITDVRVLDACAGAGHIWGAMREHVTISSWVRSDTAPRQVGTLRLSALQAVQALDLGGFNVIDIDPYGEPWDAYLAALPQLREPVAVFLTRGRVQFCVTSKSVMIACGVPPTWAVPRTPKFAAFLDDVVLSQTWHYAKVVHASVVELPNVTYYALGLHPHVKRDKLTA
jgi:hypothetical protein